MKSRWTLLLKIATMTMLLHLPAISFANVDESDRSCLMCHKYPGLGYVTTAGNIKKQVIQRVLYVNEELFDSSYHGAVPCKSCHTEDAEGGVVTPLNKTMSQWDRFFKKAKHDAGAWESFSEQDLLDINQFLFDHAVDSDQPETCG